MHNTRNSGSSCQDGNDNLLQRIASQCLLRHHDAVQLQQRGYVLLKIHWYHSFCHHQFVRVVFRIEHSIYKEIITVNILLLNSGSKNGQNKYLYRTFETNFLALLRSELASRIILFDVGLEVKYPVQYPCSSEAYGKKSSFFVGHASFVLPCRAITLQKILCFILLEIRWKYVYRQYLDVMCN